MKDPITIAVNHKVLVWAREAIVLNRANAAEKTGIPPKRLIQLEEGERQPTLEELKDFSKAYKRTIATLLLTNPPKEKPLPPDRRTIDSKFVGNFHEKTIMAVRKARALAISLMELKQDAGILSPRFQYKASLQDNPLMIAQKIRTELNLSEIREYTNVNLGLEAYVEKIESIGVAVFQLTLTQDNLRGFSIVDEDIPIIGIKRGGEPATAKIFTLFHELGHIILNEGGLCDLSYNTSLQIEKWCNAFSAEILIPVSELLQMKIVIEQAAKGDKIWAKKDLIELANYFHVGPLAILRSLLESNLTTAEYYKDRHLAWNKPSFGRAKHPEGRNLAKETIKEKGRAYVSLAFSAFDQNRIDLKDLSDFLGIKLSYISKTRQLLNV
ncbi:XRE family transcriptional regulator [Daejeonella sp.]|uniref:ImmA/IrrE family metallo-endopeptidase n=1 Tax=Daejeonella sp. TaxID=2805397 RepID=UPI0030BB4CBE